MPKRIPGSPQRFQTEQEQHSRELESKNNEILQLNEIIEQKNNEINQLNEIIQQKTNKINSLKQTISERNSTISKVLPAIRKISEWKKKINNYSEIVQENQKLKQQLQKLKNSQTTKQIDSEDTNELIPDSPSEGQNETTTTDQISELKKQISQLEDENRNLKEQLNIENNNETDNLDSESTNLAQEMLQLQLKEKQLLEVSLEDARSVAIATQARRIKQLEEELRNRDGIINSLRDHIECYKQIENDINQLKEEIQLNRDKLLEAKLNPQ